MTLYGIQLTSVRLTAAMDLFLSCFETGSDYVARTPSKLPILLPSSLSSSMTGVCHPTGHQSLLVASFSARSALLHLLPILKAFGPRMTTEEGSRGG